MRAHAQEAADREYGIRLLAVGADEEVVNLADRFVGIVDNAAADDLRRAIASRQRFHINLDEFDRLLRSLRSGGPGEKGDANRRCACESHGYLHSLSSLARCPYPVSACQEARDCRSRTTIKRRPRSLFLQ